jgi:hypothetical protein
LEHFRSGLVQPWGIAVWQDILSGRWGLGNTEGQVAARLGCDPRRAYTGQNEGVLTTQILVTSLVAASREPECLPKVAPLRAEMVRSGHIAAIRYGRALLAGNVRRKPTLASTDFEMLRVIHKHFVDWYPHHLDFLITAHASKAYQEFAVTLLGEVLRIPNLFPSSFSPMEKASARAFLQQMTDPGRLPASWLEHLIEGWLKPFLLALNALQLTGAIQ